MPSYQRQVGFAPTASVSRLPKDYELNAIIDFARHASHCHQCADPWKSHLKSRTLCKRGHQYARNVAHYIYNNGGKPCSTTEQEDYQPVHIEIPAGCEVVRGLLKAIERGFRLHKSKKAEPVISYDPTYFVSRRPVEKKHRPRIEIVDPPTRHGYENLVYVDEPRRYYDPAPPVRQPTTEYNVVYVAPRERRDGWTNSVYDTSYYR
ncbi:MAG: hypothetical protein M1833_003079 [Piccolia ochrophora]|nr:MAG: hypothetical protein M1833_003079 [Piccolia ochrophora]